MKKEFTVVGTTAVSLLRFNMCVPWDPTTFTLKGTDSRKWHNVHRKTLKKWFINNG